jgi:hypothetical protein
MLTKTTNTPPVAILGIHKNDNTTPVASPPTRDNDNTPPAVSSGIRKIVSTPLMASHDLQENGDKPQSILMDAIPLRTNTIVRIS